MTANPIEIIGSGYFKNVEIGQSFLKENVINMWSFPPTGAFIYYASGIQMTLQVWTKVSNATHSCKTILVEEITQEIKDALVAKGRTIQ